MRGFKLFKGRTPCGVDVGLDLEEAIGYNSSHFATSYGHSAVDLAVQIGRTLALTLLLLPNLEQALAPLLVWRAFTIFKFDVPRYVCRNLTGLGPLDLADRSQDKKLLQTSRRPPDTHSLDFFPAARADS